MQNIHGDKRKTCSHQRLHVLAMKMCQESRLEASLDLAMGTSTCGLGRPSVSAIAPTCSLYMTYVAGSPVNATNNHMVLTSNDYNLAPIAKISCSPRTFQCTVQRGLWIWFFMKTWNVKTIQYIVQRRWWVWSLQNLTRCFFFKGVAGLIPDENIQIHIRFISHSIYCSLGVVDQIPDKNTKVTFTSN